jgi:predicted HTH domain antitoxin
MSIIISDEIIHSTSYTEFELRLEISIFLYQKKILSIGQASKMTQLSRLKYQKELADRKVPINYDLDDFKNDLETLEVLFKK